MKIDNEMVNSISNSITTVLFDDIHGYTASILKPNMHGVGDFSLILTIVVIAVYDENVHRISCSIHVVFIYISNPTTNDSFT
jgi:hypothetical protein